MNVLEVFEDYQEEDTLYLFPSASTQLYWTRKISQIKECISIEKFITFPQFIRILQLQLFQDPLGSIHTPVRFLTRNEQKLMAHYLLTNEHARQLIYRIEHILPADPDNGIPLEYTQKLVKMLNVYMLYTTRTEPTDQAHSTTEHSFKEELLALVALYDTLLQSCNCMDMVSFTYRLHAMKYTERARATAPHSERELPLIPHVKIMCSELFHPDTKMWLAYFGTQKNRKKEDTEAASNSSEMYESGWFTYEDIPCSTYFQKEAEPVSAIHASQTSVAAFPSYLQQQHGSSPVLHAYENTEVELETIFSAISDLLQNGVSPNDIGLTVCEPLFDELTLLSLKYQVPLSMTDNTMQLSLFLSLIQKCYASNFSPLVVKQLIFEPLVPWKYREIFIDIINIGLTQACYNDESLSRWRYILSRTRTHHLVHSQEIVKKDSTAEISAFLLEFFNNFVAAITSMIRAPSLQELYITTEYFFRQYIDTPLRSLGQTIDDSEDLANMLLKEIESLYSFEKYLQSFSVFQSDLYDTATPWTIFNMLVRVVNRKTTSRHSCVQVYEFPYILGTAHPYKIICNISQAFITKSLEYNSHFNDYLSQLYDTQENIDEFQKYRKNVLACVNNTATQLYLSGSEQGMKERRTLPSYWRPIYKVYNDTGIYNMWEKENIAWKYLMQELIVTPHQISGLMHQQKVQLGCTKPVLSYHTLEKNIFTQLFTTREIMCHATALHTLFSPKEFLFETILGAQELLAEWNHGMHELMNWGKAYHALIERGIILLKEKEQQESIEPYLEDNTALLQLLFPEEQSMESFLITLNIHPYLKDSFRYAIKNERWNECLKDIMPLLGTEEVFLQSEISRQKSVQEIMALLHTCISPKKISGLRHSVAHDLFSQFFIKGRVDLLYSNPLGYKHIIDFKFKKNSRITQYLFQLWIYHIIINAEYISQAPHHISLYSDSDTSDTEKDFTGKLYFLKKTTAKRSQLYPTTEEKDIDAIIDIVSEFPRLLYIGAALLQELYAIPPALEDAVQEKIATLVGDSSFISQLIVRKDCYVYIK